MSLVESVRRMLTDEILIAYVKTGIISLGDVISLGKDEIMKRILKQVHKYSITPPKKPGDRWSTYVMVGNKRKLVTRNNQLDLENYLLDFYCPSISASKLSLENVFDEYLEYKNNFTKVANKKKAISPTTVKRWQRDFDNYFRGTSFAKTKISQFTKKTLELFLLAIIKERQPKESFASNLLGYISQTFEYAYREGYIEENVFNLVDRKLLLAHTPTPEKQSDEERVLNVFEIRKLRNAIYEHLDRHPSYAPDYAILLALETGMRVGEIVALEWSDIHDGYIYIDKMERRIDERGKGSYLVIDEPKGLKHRKFPITESIELLLERIKNNLGVSNRFIFNVNERRCTERAVEGAVSRRGKECGIDKASIHRIRRTVSSELNKRLPRTAVCNLLGHNPETNVNHYDYDNVILTEKIRALDSMYSNVITKKCVDKKMETLVQ